MADKSISELTPASQINEADLFVLEQSAQAKKLTGQILMAWIAQRYSALGYIESIEKTSTSGLVDTYTITFSGSAEPVTFTVTNGEKGDKGDSWYMHIRYSDAQPTRDADMKTTPSNWMGVYSGTSQTAPTTYTSYSWFKIKGESGPAGPAAAIESAQIRYQESTSGTVVPTGTWTASVPSIQQGHFLWTRTVISFNDGTDVTSYSVSYKGVDGSGAGDMQKSVYDPNGDVETAGGISEYVTGITDPMDDHLNDIDSDITELQTGKVPKIVSGTTRKVYIHEGETQSDLELSDIGTAFTITLGTTWTNKAQTISDARFKASGFAYEVSPSPSNFKAYGEAQIYADNVTTDGQMTFHCEEVPSGALVVNVKRSIAE